MTVHSKSVFAEIFRICCLSTLLIVAQCIASGFVCSTKAPPNLPVLEPSPKNRPVGSPAQCSRSSPSIYPVIAAINRSKNE